MHFSRLTLNPRSRAVRRDTSNPYFMHQTLARVLNGDGLTLWRLEDTILLVQSQERPDWGQLEPGYLARTSESKSVDLTRLTAIKRPLRFRLRANPNKAEAQPRDQRSVRKSGTTQSGKRVGLYELDDQIAWLTVRAESNGFELMDFTVSNSDRWTFRKDPAGVPITLAVAEFDGHLRIRDPERFQTTLENGLGRGKALGLGLLSVAPAS